MISFIKKKFQNIGVNLTQQDQAEDSSFLKAAIDAGWAFITFDPEGNILSANNIFLQIVGYKVNDLVGAHHSLLCTAAYVSTTEYQNFWKNLAAGQVNSGEFSRVHKDGKEIWLNASYTPVKDKKGNIVKVIKIASDITEMVQSRDRANWVQNAVDSGWASIQFDQNGHIREVNENFLHTFSYSKAEIIGGHHKLFCKNEYTLSDEYQSFWHKLREGQIFSGEFERFDKNGKSIWTIL